MTDKQKRNLKILYMVKRGHTNAEIAAAFDLHSCTISAIRKNYGMSRKPLTRKDHAQIINMYCNQHIPQYTIAEKYSVTPKRIQQIISMYKAV